MPVDEQMKATFRQRAIRCLNVDGDIKCPNEDCQAVGEWEFGEVGAVKGIYNNPVKGPAKLAEGLAVPILCRWCKGFIRYYDELPEPP